MGHLDNRQEEWMCRLNKRINSTQGWVYHAIKTKKYVWWTPPADVHHTLYSMAYRKQRCIPEVVTHTIIAISRVIFMMKKQVAKPWREELFMMKTDVHDLSRHCLINWSSIRLRRNWRWHAVRKDNKLIIYHIKYLGKFQTGQVIDCQHLCL